LIVPPGSNDSLEARTAAELAKKKKKKKKSRQALPREEPARAE
jgi:hypothetical protein